MRPLRSAEEGKTYFRIRWHFWSLRERFKAEEPRRGAFRFFPFGDIGRRQAADEAIAASDSGLIDRVGLSQCAAVRIQILPYPRAAKEISAQAWACRP